MDSWKTKAWVFMLDFNKAKAAAAMSRRLASTQQDCPGFSLHTKDRFGAGNDWERLGLGHLQKITGHLAFAIEQNRMNRDGFCKG